MKIIITQYRDANIVRNQTRPVLIMALAVTTVLGTLLNFYELQIPHLLN